MPPECFQGPDHARCLWPGNRTQSRNSHHLHTEETKNKVRTLLFSGIFHEASRPSARESEGQETLTAGDPAWGSRWAMPSVSRTDTGRVPHTAGRQEARGRCRGRVFSGERRRHSETRRILGVTWGGPREGPPPPTRPCLSNYPPSRWGIFRSKAFLEMCVAVYCLKA